ncbi:AVN_HP_G0119550.mRNA.1.CDS.1 [Saccharomyces cerevisiae]|nr:AVN_HP_G0119550.mRNA.1.CDS.1 [Saccharomyces cerevisiae]CAI6996692.1 AVN_HP_G0119550.mRNA.1.CDS.1 [Saccharomyces cerevisiae]
MDSHMTSLIMGVSPPITLNPSQVKYLSECIESAFVMCEVPHRVDCSISLVFNPDWVGQGGRCGALCIDCSMTEQQKSNCGKMP